MSQYQCFFLEFDGAQSGCRSTCPGRPDPRDISPQDDPEEKDWCLCGYAIGRLVSCVYEIFKGSLLNRI